MATSASHACEPIASAFVVNGGERRRHHRSPNRVREQAMSQVKWNHRALRALSFLVLMGAGLACSDPVSGPMTVGDASPRGLKGAYGAWTQALSAELAPPGASASFNTAALDGCPYIAPDGKTF